jgi:excisionase family DNA binding protein
MQYYTTKEVAKILKLNQETVRRFIREGRIKTLVIGGKYHRISEEELNRFTSAT